MMDLLDGVRRNTKHNHTTVTEYDTLGKYISRWIEGTGHKFMVVLGRPGVLKSSTVRAAISGTKHLWIEGDTGPLAFYRDAFLHRNEPTVLDDLKLTGQVRSLLQSMTDNYTSCTLRWASAKPPKVWAGGEGGGGGGDEDEGRAEGEGGGGQKITLPTLFSTTSPVCWITNDVDRLSDMVGLMDRSYVVEFDPPVSAVLERCRPFVDSEVWSWAERHKRLLPNLSVRDLETVP